MQFFSTLVLLSGVSLTLAQGFAQASGANVLAPHSEEYCGTVTKTITVTACNGCPGGYASSTAVNHPSASSTGGYYPPVPTGGVPPSGGLPSGGLPSGGLPSGTGSRPSGTGSIVVPTQPPQPTISQFPGAAGKVSLGSTFAALAAGAAVAVFAL